jgi:DNA modification methylase
MPTKHEIIFGDSRDALKTIKPESIALVVTSPPYFVNRSYESYISDENEYWALMNDVFSQMSRIVEPHGKVVINFADRYANKQSMGKVCETLYAHRFDDIMSRAGFDLWGRIIWDKGKVFINGATHLAAPSNKSGQMRIAPNFEYIFIWKKNSASPIPHKNVDMTNEERIAWTDGVWTFSSVSVNEEENGFKLAKFPKTIPYRLIKMYTQPEDTVLDPFAGTNTVGKVARELGRNSIGIEKDLRMKTYILRYMNSKQLELFGNDSELIIME